MILVIEFSDRILKRAVDRFDPVAQQILETNHERETEAALPRFVHDFHNIDDAAVFLERT